MPFIGIFHNGMVSLGSKEWVRIVRKSFLGSKIIKEKNLKIVGKSP